MFDRECLVLIWSGLITIPWTGRACPRLRPWPMESPRVISTLGGTGVSGEWPEMQRAPESSCCQNTSTITPLGCSADSVPGIPTNLAPTGICTIISVSNVPVVLNRAKINLLQACNIELQTVLCLPELRHQMLKWEWPASPLPWQLLAPPALRYSRTLLREL